MKQEGPSPGTASAVSTLSPEGEGKKDSPSPFGERVDTREARRGEGPFRRLTPARDLARARAARAAMTEAETRLWNRLRDHRLNGWKFKRQTPLGGVRPDFTCAKAGLIVEVDGSQHADDAPQDARRTAFLGRQGYRVLRVWNNDVLARMDAVLEAILAELTDPHPAQASPESTLSPEGEGKADSPSPSGERVDTREARRGEGA